jgi:CheY-like chemotaxis protein
MNDNSEPSILVRPKKLNGVSLLIVEDDADVRDFLTQALEFAGAKVCTAENGNEGVAAMLRAHFDIVITDFRMPEADGRVVIEHCRQTAKPVLPVILVTGYSDIGKDELEKSGAVVLSKPVSVKEIVERITQMISLKPAI